MSKTLAQVAAESHRPIGGGILEQANHDLNKIEELARRIERGPVHYSYRKYDSQEIVRLVKGIRTDLKGIGRLLSDQHTKETDKESCHAGSSPQHSSQPSS
jgi:hypothetical protein